MTKRSKIKPILLWVLRVIIYALSILGSLLMVSLKWLKETWGPVSFSTALFQIKTPMVGVDSNIVETYVKDIAMPAVLIPLLGIIILCLVTKAMKTTGYSLKVGINKLGILDITYRPIVVIGTIGLLIGCWAQVPGLAKDTGVPDYVDSLIHRSTIYENYYVVPTDDLLTFPEQKRNLVLIYVESLESSYLSVDEGGGMPSNLIPNITAIASENVSFSNTDSFGGATQTQNVGWTMAALLTTSSGVTYNAPIDSNDMQSYSRFLPGLRTLGDILYDNGYDNYFVCGSDSGFGGRKSYFLSHGNYAIHDFTYASETGYLPAGYHNGYWGMGDAQLFDMAREELTSIASEGRPFNYTILTADTHPPEGFVCDLCEPIEGEGPLQTAIRCSDRQVSQFVEWLKEQDWYENTTVIIIGDHLLMSDVLACQMPEGYQRHVFNCFINLPSGVAPVNTNNRLFATTDYFPTILAAMGVEINGDRLGLGTNLFSERETLLEEMGEDAYNTEVLRYSDYYFNNFV